MDEKEQQIQVLKETVEAHVFDLWEKLEALKPFMAKIGSVQDCSTKDKQLYNDLVQQYDKQCEDLKSIHQEFKASYSEYVNDPYFLTESCDPILNDVMRFLLTFPKLLQKTEIGKDLPFTIESEIEKKFKNPQ